MKTINIELSNGRTLEVKQLPLRRYAELLKALQNLPKQLGDITSLSNDELFNQLPVLLANSFPDLLNILPIATDLTKDEIESDEFGLKDATSVILAVMEVNDYRTVFEQIKKAMAQPTTKIPNQTKAKAE